MTALSLSFDGLLSTLQSSIGTLSDPRRPSNGRIYSLSDAMLGAFGAFYFQDILALTKYLYFDSWNALLAFMLAPALPKKAMRRRRSSRDTS